jgi:hypothetical protein
MVRLEVQRKEIMEAEDVTLDDDFGSADLDKAMRDLNLMTDDNGVEFDLTAALESSGDRRRNTFLNQGRHDSVANFLGGYDATSQKDMEKAKDNLAGMADDLDALLDDWLIDLKSIDSVIKCLLKHSACFATNFASSNQPNPILWTQLCKYSQPNTSTTLIDNRSWRRVPTFTCDKILLNPPCKSISVSKIEKTFNYCSHSRPESISGFRTTRCDILSPRYQNVQKLLFNRK